MSDRIVKPLDQFRSSALPRLEDKSKLPQTQLLMSKTTGSIGVKEKAQDNKIFTLDRGPKFEQFSLPGKPEQTSLLMKDSTGRKKTVQKLKAVEVSSELDVEQSSEFDFLAGAMGKISTLKSDTTRSSPAKLGKTTGGQTSDLDEIHSIMKGIRTGGDVMNFLADMVLILLSSLFIVFKLTTPRNTGLTTSRCWFRKTPISSTTQY